MGVDAQDYDNDGWEDIHFTALTGETFPLFRNESGEDTRDVRRGDAVQSGLAALTVKSSGWCAIVADFDNDGWKDMFTANSHVNDRIGDVRSARVPPAEQPVPQRRPRALPRRDRWIRARDRPAPPPRLRRSPTSTPTAASISSSCRSGSAGGVVAERQSSDHALADRPAGRHEEQPRRHRRTGHVGNQVRTMTTAMGYASSSHAGLHFGLGDEPGPLRVEVQWPSGIRQTIENVEVNRVLEVTER